MVKYKCHLHQKLMEYQYILPWEVNFSPKRSVCEPEIRAKAVCCVMLMTNSIKLHNLMHFLYMNVSAKAIRYFGHLGTSSVSPSFLSFSPPLSFSHLSIFLSPLFLLAAHTYIYICIYSFSLHIYRIYIGYSLHT